MKLQLKVDRLIALQAAEWFETMRLGRESEYPEFVRWISESPRHMEAFLAISSEQAALRKLFAEKRLDLSALREASEVVPMSALASDAQSQARPRLEWSRRFAGTRRGAWLAAAAVAVIAFSAIWIAVPGEQHYETAIGEQRVVQLLEGSVLNLNANSSVTVKFTDAERNIELTRGEVLLKVAHDTARPFRVRTPSAVVEATGTQFNVYLQPNGTTKVSVLEGKVRVSSTLANNSDSATQTVGATLTTASNHGGAGTALIAGQEVRVEKSGNIEELQGVNVADTMAWQRRKLVFKRTSLQEIAEEFNRYNKTQRLRVEGLNADTFRYSGAFDADDPKSLADLLAREPDLSVSQNGGEIVIRGR